MSDTKDITVRRQIRITLFRSRRVFAEVTGEVAAVENLLRAIVPESTAIAVDDSREPVTIDLFPIGEYLVINKTNPDQS